MSKKGLIKDVVLVICIIALAIATAYSFLTKSAEKIPAFQITSPPEITVSAIKVYFRGNDIWIDVTIKNTSKDNQTMLIEVTAYGATVVLRDFWATPLLPGKEATVSAQYVAKTSFPEQITIVIKKRT
ncbi:MAG: hypothetical protein QXL85_07730 [Candidatus Bathyarchaeia archaeon]